MLPNVPFTVYVITVWGVNERNISSTQGRRQGVCLGGGRQNVLATAARAPTFCASPERVAQQGEGDSNTLFPTSKNVPKLS